MVLDLEEMHEKIMELRLQQAMTSNKLARLDAPSIWERVEAAKKRAGLT